MATLASKILEALEAQVDFLSIDDFHEVFKANTGELRFVFVHDASKAPLAVVGTNLLTGKESLIDLMKAAKATELVLGKISEAAQGFFGNCVDFTSFRETAKGHEALEVLLVPSQQLYLVRFP